MPTVIHLDADEIPHSYQEGETFSEAINRADMRGFNVIDFNEFVFLPIDYDYNPTHIGNQPMRFYYFFEPAPLHRMIAWKKISGLSMIEHAGHRLVGEDIRLSPEKMALRHYIFRNQQHAFNKYADRQFVAHDLGRGWHGNRVNQPVDNFRFPSADRLSFLETAQSRDFDRSRPCREHYWQW